MTDEQTNETQDEKMADSDILPVGDENAKIIGELEDSDGIGVLGRNTASTGKTFGVTGVVDSAEGYGLYTPDNARIEGDLMTNYLATAWASQVSLKDRLNLNNNDLVDGGTIIWDHFSKSVPTARLADNQIDVDVGTGLAGGGAVSLGDSTTLNVDLDAIAGENLTVDTDTNRLDASGFGSSFWVDSDGNGLLEPSDSATGIEVDEARTDSLTDNGAGSLSLDTLLDLDDNDLADAGTTIWDSANGQVPQERLEHDSLTVAGNPVSLGASTGIAHADLDSVSEDQHHAKDHDHTESDVSTVPNTGLANDTITRTAGTGLTYSSGSAGTALGESATLGLAVDGVTGTELDLASIAGTGLSVDTDNDRLDADGEDTWADSDGNNLLEPTGSATGIEVTDLLTDTLGDSSSGDLTLETLLDLDGNDLTDSGTTIWDSTNGQVPQARLENDSLTVTAGTGLSGGGGVTLGNSVSLDIDTGGIDTPQLASDAVTTAKIGPDEVTSGEIDLASIAGENVTVDTMNDELDVTSTSQWQEGDDNTLLEPTSKDGIEVDTIADNGAGPVSLASALALSGNDLVDGGTTVWDSSSGYVPQGRLENTNVTVAGNAVSLGGSTNIAHADLGSVTEDQHHTKDHDHTEADISAVPNSGLSNDTITRTAGTGLTYSSG
jgi:hypothetical protein